MISQSTHTVSLLDSFENKRQTGWSEDRCAQEQEEVEGKKQNGGILWALPALLK